MALADYFEKTTFDILAPEFKATDSGTLEVLAKIASDQANKDVFGTRHAVALIYLVAHMLKMGERGGDIVGPVTSETVGSLSRSYGTIANSKDTYGSTSYGAEYLRIRKMVVISPFVSC